MVPLRAQASRLIFLYRPRFPPRRLACRCRPAGGGRKRGIRNCFGKLNDPGKQGLRRLGILPQQLRTYPFVRPFDHVPHLDIAAHRRREPSRRRGPGHAGRTCHRGGVRCPGPEAAPVIGSLRDRGIVGASRGLWSRIVFRRFRAGRILIADLDGGGVDALGSELRNSIAGILEDFPHRLPHRLRCRFGRTPLPKDEHHSLPSTSQACHPETL